jgi:DNA-directed RNA polymerase specialized sigma24 family protein
MFDPKSPLGALVDAELRKDGVLLELRTMAMRMIPSRDKDEAKDLVAKSLLRVVEPNGDPWHPGGHTFLAHMHGVMRQLRYRQVRSLGRERVVADGDVAQENTAGDEPRPDDDLGRRRSLEVSRMLGDRVLARLGDDPRARQLFEFAMKEDLDPSEQAERLGCSVDEVRAAAKRLRYHGRLVLAEWNAGEERRMQSLQEQATTTNEEGIP